MSEITPRKRPLVRWPFIVLALIPVVGVIALYISLGEPPLIQPGTGPLLSQRVEAWAWTIGIGVVIVGLPPRTLRWIILLCLLAAILAVLVL